MATNIKVLVDMIASDAVGTGLPTHYFDEHRNREYIEREEASRPNLNIPENIKKLPPIRYNYEIIKDKDGHLHEVEDNVIPEKYDIGLIRGPDGKLRWSK